MRLPRDLSGRAVARALVKDLEYRIIHERGSHIVLETESPTHQRIAIPDHSTLRVGTLNAIIKAIASHKDIEKSRVIFFLSVRYEELLARSTLFDLPEAESNFRPGA